MSRISESAADQLDSAASATSNLVAKFRLIDEGEFWTTDFPCHIENSLTPKDDKLLAEFLGEINYLREGDALSLAD